MRIVVVSENLPFRLRLVADLVNARRDAVGVSHDRAEQELRRELPQILVVELACVADLDLLRSLCAIDPTGEMYVMTIVGPGLPSRTVASAVAAGSHDFLCAPFSIEELRAHVDVQRRLRRWMFAQTLPVLVQPRSALTDLRAWEYLGDVLVEDLETMLGQPVIIEEGWLELSTTIQLATIAMTLPTEQLELCVSIVADTTTRHWLGTTLLLDAAASDDALDDIMRELANVAGGALKRAALIEGPILSTGIPIDGRSLPARDSGARSWTIAIEPGVVIGVVGEVRRRANRRIAARRLCEGMIVVDDVRNDAGVLLLASGTRLTSTTAQRLSTMLDAAFVEVSM